MVCRSAWRGGSSVSPWPQRILRMYSVPCEARWTPLLRIMAIEEIDGLVGMIVAKSNGNRGHRQARTSDDQPSIAGRDHYTIVLADPGGSRFLVNRPHFAPGTCLQDQAGVLFARFRPGGEETDLAGDRRRGLLRRHQWRRRPY